MEQRYSSPTGQQYKAIMPYSPNNAVTQSYFNSKGQTSSDIDPDGVTTLYQYNGKGEREYTVTDMYRDGQMRIDTGTNPVTHTISYVAYDRNMWLQLSQTSVWTDSGSDLVVSQSETSLDGLETWQTSFGQITHSQTVYNGGGSRTVTVTNPDNTQTVSQYQDGVLQSVTRKDASNNQLGQTTYGYDAYVLTPTVSDARSGATTYTYNDGDQVTSVTTPVPGPNQTAQVTTTYYDPMGRPCRIVQPDSTSVTNEYTLKGELERTYWSRTYPWHTPTIRKAEKRP